MKWFASLLILMMIGGSFCDDDEEENCYMRKRDECREIQIPTEFPETPEDSLAACRAVISKGSCMLEASETCDDGPDLPIAERIKRNLDYFKSTCQEDNPTFIGISSNLPCVKRVLESPKLQCRHMFSDKNVKAIDAQIELLLGEDYESELAGCLFDLMHVACQGVLFGYHCGEEVKDAVEEIEAHVNSPKALECRAEHLEEVSTFLTEFEILLTEDLTLKNAPERKRK